jgi:hypothetical protein
MRYKLRVGVEIKTENAAKPASQASQFLLRLIEELPHVSSTFDYGCGKLRYQVAIKDKTDTLALVDSEIQLSRIQVLGTEKTSIRAIFYGSNQILTLTDSEFVKINTRFDRGFCVNVLSVIPSVRYRKTVLEAIQAKLKRGGKCLFVVQYRNSEFNRMKAMPNARPWLDGFLVDSLRGYSFYGLISPDRLESSLKRAGFRISETTLNEGSVYMWATPVR